MFTPYRVMKELGARLPETASIGRKVLPLSARASFERQVLCERWQGRVVHFDMERTKQVAWCCQWKGRIAGACVSGAVQACQGSPELAGWEHIHLKHSEPSS